MSRTLTIVEALHLEAMYVSSIKQYTVKLTKSNGGSLKSSNVVCL